MNQFLIAIGTGSCVALVVYLIYRGRLLSLRRQLATALEQVEVCANERDLAQQELVSRLEQERELEKEKVQLNSQLSDFEKYASLAQLALGAAHEINNPLLGIMSHLELEMRGSNGDHKAEIEQCIEGVRRISSTIRGLMDYARPDPLTLKLVNLHSLTAHSFAFLAVQPLFNRLELHNCIPNDLPEIVADENQMSQALTNLLMNAAQATPPGGSITVTAEAAKSGNAIEMRVRDTGTGVPSDILPHVFEPFFTTKRGTGTGLGLSITRNYVLRHGGDIQIQSVPGAGTTVRVTLPIRQVLQPKPELEQVVV